MRSLKNIVAAISIPLLTIGPAIAHHADWHTGGGGNGNGNGNGCNGNGNPNCVPEIDISESFAAIAIILCIALIIREKFLRN